MSNHFRTPCEGTVKLVKAFMQCKNGCIYCSTSYTVSGHSMDGSAPSPAISTSSSALDDARFRWMSNAWMQRILRELVPDPIVGESADRRREDLIGILGAPEAQTSPNAKAIARIAAYTYLLCVLRVDGVDRFRAVFGGTGDTLVRTARTTAAHAPAVHLDNSVESDLARRETRACADFLWLYDTLHAIPPIKAGASGSHQP